MSLPLDGIRVLDLTNFLSGPYCTQMLADLGAEVIKVEATDGDSSRSIPPHFIGEDSAYFLANNRSKSSIVVDLKSDRGAAVVRALIEESDVVVENFRPGTLRRLGLDHEEIRLGKPELIWASISGFGQTGPWRDRPAYDMIVQALSGSMSITGEPGGAAVRLGPPMGDLAASLFAAIGVLSALTGRAITGLGRTIDVSMLDAQLSLLSYQAVYAMVSGEAPGKQGARHDSIPTYRSFKGGDDREFVVTANTQRMWQAVCRVVGLPHLIDDPRFVDAGERLVNREALWRLLEQAFLANNAEEWVERLTAADVPAAMIKTIPEALEDAEMAERGMVTEMESERRDRVRTMATPIIFEREPLSPGVYPPRLGQHSRDVLKRVLGMSVDEVEALIDSGAVRDEDTSRSIRVDTSIPA